ncbi:MAG: ACT domain-containing protein [Candidatus Hermodarchaeota archaeon]
MKGISDLKTLFKTMKPKVIEGEYVFCTISPQKYTKSEIKPICVFYEEEGVTLIIERKIAEHNSLPYSDVWAWITLTVHSNLAAIGFLATVTSKLAKADISVNVVSAYYHDHLFVPIEKIDFAMQLLLDLSKSRGSNTY